MGNPQWCASPIAGRLWKAASSIYRWLLRASLIPSAREWFPCASRSSPPSIQPKASLPCRSVLFATAAMPNAYGDASVFPIRRFSSINMTLPRGSSIVCALARFRVRMPRANSGTSCATGRASSPLWSGSTTHLQQEGSVSADCLFCKIGDKKIPSKLVYQDEEIFAFEDISPQAPTHILLCPRKHFASLNEAASSDQSVLGKLQLVAAQ